MENQVSKVVIEVCQGCKTHQWNTRHDQAKYNRFYQMIAEALKTTIGDNVLVYKNMVPKEYLMYDVYSGLCADDRKRSLLRMQPRVGAFQVFYKDYVSFQELRQCIYSKIKTTLWPRIGLVARKMNSLITRLRNNEDVTSLFTSMPNTRSCKSPMTTLTRAQTSKSLARPASGSASRQKFISTYTQGFGGSPEKGYTKYSPVRSSRSKTAKTDRLEIMSLSPTDHREEEKEERKRNLSENPIQVQEMQVRTIKKDSDGYLKGQPHDASTEAASHGGSRAVSPVNIQVIQSAEQDLYLFGALKQANIPQGVAGQERDVFDQEEEVKQAPASALPPRLREGDDFDDGYLDDVQTDGEQIPDAPKLSVSKSEKQPIYYFGESGPGGMAVMHQEEVAEPKKKKKNQGYNSSDSGDSDYSCPTPVELSVQESPEQGVLFDQMRMAGIAPVFIAAHEQAKQQQDESEDYGGDSFDVSHDNSRVQKAKQKSRSSSSSSSSRSSKSSKSHNSSKH